MIVTKHTAAFVQALLFAINFLNFYDRQALGAVAESIRQEWQLGCSV